MIIKNFNNGWGDQLPIKRLERQILDEFLAMYQINDMRTVIINNTWYTDDFHQRIMKELVEIDPDLIFFVSLLDPPAPRPDIYPDPKTIGIGYYPGPGAIDFWALAVAENIIIPEIGLDPDLSFMCLNRKPHWHRMRLYEQMRENQLLDQGLVSMGGWSGRAERVLPNDQGGSDMAPNAGTDQNGIKNDIFSLGNPSNWNRCLVNIVTETVYDVEDINFVSEKIYKPILGCRPFLVYAPGGARSWLEARGFQTYLDDWHDVIDLDLGQPNNIVPFLKALSTKPTLYLREKLLALQPKIQYNKKRFWQYCEQQRNNVRKGLACPV